MAQWKQDFQSLAQAGPGAILAIREFLAKNSDINLRPEDAQELGYATVRTALFDALAQIGGPEAVAATLQTLHETADPREVALLAQNLEKMEPGLHRPEELAAARESLAMAANGQLPNKDVAPLFEVFQRYGDASATLDMEQAARHWNYYAMLTLAQLPEDAGIPALVRVVQGQEGTDQGFRSPALEMLALTASHSEDAKAALLDQVRQNMLTPFNWATLGPILSGEQVGFLNSAFAGAPNSSDNGSVRISHIDIGNQTIYRVQRADQMTSDQISQQLALINDLLAATTDPAATRILQQSKASLTGGLSQPGATR